MKVFPTRMLGPYHKKEERTVCLQLKAKIDVSQEWAANQTDAEIIQQLQSRFDSSLGFRGELKGLKIKVV